MFNKFAKSIRWIVLAGMLYSLYVMMFKDDIKFNNQTDEKTLIEMAEKTKNTRDKLVINRQLITLFPKNKTHQKSFEESVKEQANKLMYAHEKMLFPMPLGNYRYVRNIRFAKDKDSKYVLILNLTSIFDEKTDEKTQKTLAKMLRITHNGMYQHFGFKEMRLLLAPTFDSLDDVDIIDLNRTTLELPELGADTAPSSLPNK